VNLKWLEGITILLMYQLMGEGLVFVLELPVPGPVVGMLLLFITLLLIGSLSHSLDITASQLLSHLSLLFIPAGVGVMLHFTRIEAEWLPITLSLILSTILGLAFTAWCMQLLQSLQARRGDGSAG